MPYTKKISPEIICCFCLLTTWFVADAARAKEGYAITPKELAEVRLLNGRNFRWESSGLILSPDGSHALVLELQPDVDANANRYVWRLFNLERRGKQVAVFDAGLPMIGKARNFLAHGLYEMTNPVWSATGDWFIFVRRTERGDEIVRGAARNGKLKKVADFDSEITAILLSRDDAELFITSRKSPEKLAEALAAERRTGYLVDGRFIPYQSKEPLSTQAVPAPGGSDEPSLSDLDYEFYVLTMASKALRVVYEDEKVSWTDANAPAPENVFPTQGEIAEAPDGRLAWRELLDPKRQGFAAPSTIVASSASRPRIVCRHQECTDNRADLSSVKGPFSIGENSVVFMRREGASFETTVLYKWHPDTDELRQLFTTTKHLRWCEATQTKWFCFESDYKKPKVLISIDLQSGKRELLYDPNPDFPALDQIRLTRFPVDVDGDYATFAVVASPKKGPGPLVIVSYRCGNFLKGGHGDENPIYPLVERGFSVLCFDHPGYSWRWGQTAKNSNELSRNATGGDWPAGEFNYRALGRAIEIAEDRGLVEGKKRAITGLSAGSTLAWYDLQRRSYTAAALASGVDYNAGYLLGGEYTRGIINGRGWSRAVRDMRTPDPKKIKTPILINVSEQDFLYSVTTFTRLKDAGVPVEMRLYMDETHQKSQPAHRLAIYVRNIDWFRFWLQDYEDPDPDKAEQYARWRNMRDERCAREYLETASYCSAN